RCIVVVERVVNRNAVLGVSPLRCITPDRNAGGMTVIDKVIPCGDVTGGAVFVLAGQLDSKVHIMHYVLLNQNSGAAIHVNTVGVFVITVGWIAARSNVVNQIAADNSVARLINSRVWRRVLETDDIDSD